MGIPFDQILIQTVNGLVNGMILALVASGLTLIFGIMDVVNFAHGDLVMLGGFTGATTLGADRQLLAGPARGGHRHRGLRRGCSRSPRSGRSSAAIPLTTILATFGISLVLQKYALWQWGPSARKHPGADHRAVQALLPAVPLVPRSPPPCSPPPSSARSTSSCSYGKYGIWIRATTQDRVMAAGHGHPGAPRPHRGVRASAPRMAAASGVLFGPLGGVTQTMGADFTLRAFIVVVVGGMGNLGGSILAVDLHQPARGLRLAGREPRPGGDRLLRRP